MKKKALKKQATALTAMPGVVIEEEGEKRFLPKGTIFSADGRQWVLQEEAEIASK